MEAPQLSAASGVCQVKAGHVFIIRCYYHLQLMKAIECWRTETEEMSGERKKKKGRK